MTIPELQQSLNQLPFDSFTFGYSEFEFSVKDNFDDFQIGFRVDEKGKSLISEEHGDWKNSWFVIAVDDLGDPIFIDLENGVIYTSQEENSKWEPIPVASTLNQFLQIVLRLKELSEGRETPKKFERSPVPDKAKKEFYDLLNQEGEEIDTDYWGGILD